MQPIDAVDLTGGGSALAPISTTRLGDEVAARLRHYIIDGGFQEGSRLPSERALAAKLGISRSTVSQALRILSVVGLVDIRQGSGVYVRHDPGSMIGASMDLMIDLDPASVAELAEYRHGLERIAIGEPGAVDGVDLDELADSLERMTGSSGRVADWIEADASFHRTVVAGADNRYLLHAFEQAHRKILSLTYSEWIDRAAEPSWLISGRLDAQIGLHRDIADAVAGSDVDSLTQALDRHQTAVLEHLAAAIGA